MSVAFTTLVILSATQGTIHPLQRSTVLTCQRSRYRSRWYPSKSLYLVICYTNDAIITGWALTLLSQDNLSYASTCQTIGLNTGYFASFTVFLALNSEDFAYVANSRRAPSPLMSPQPEMGYPEAIHGLVPLFLCVHVLSSHDLALLHQRGSWTLLLLSAL